MLNWNQLTLEIHKIERGRSELVFADKITQIVEENSSLGEDNTPEPPFQAMATMVKKESTGNKVTRTKKGRAEVEGKNKILNRRLMGGWKESLSENKEYLENLSIMVKNVLSYYDLQGYLRYFLQLEGLVVASLLCNAAAKDFVDEDFPFGSMADYFYDMNPELVLAAAKTFPFVWHKNQGIIYFETNIGQISFHVFNNETDIVVTQESKKWSGVKMQPMAKRVAEAYLDYVIPDRNTRGHDIIRTQRELEYDDIYNRDG